MTDHPFRAIIDAGEYEYYGIRAHRGAEPIVGASLGNSYVWDDGRITDEELAGICTIKVTADTLSRALADMSGYFLADEPLVLVGGNYAEHGYDPGELIIRDNVCLAVIR